MTRWTIPLAVVVLSLNGCGLHGKPTVDRSKALALAHAASSSSVVSTEPDRIVAPGLVEPWGGDTELSPRESGWIASIRVAEGAHVATGQLLATLDDEAQRAAVDLARADLAESEAALERTLHGATREELRQARAEAEAGRARADLARRDAERATRLGQDHAVAPAEVDRSDADARAMEATAAANEARLAGLEAGSRTEDREAARERVVASRARLAQAEASLARRYVIAPIDGVVLLSRSHAGEYFGVGGAPLLVLGDTSKLQVKLEVDEIDALRLAEGAACSIYADDDERIAEGVVLRLAPEMGRRGLPIESPTARADVRVREVFVEVPASPVMLPGQRVWGHIVPREPSNPSLTALEPAHAR
jgi:HlyD family secretion protein